MSWELIYILAGLAILPMLVVGVVVSVQVNTAMARYHHVAAGGTMTAQELVERIAAEHQLNIKIERVRGGVGDHYDARDKTIRLTDQVLRGTSVTALAVAAHECGHALQDAQNYAPLRIRHAVITVSNFSNRLLMPLIVVGAIVSLFTFGMAADLYLWWGMLALCVIYGLSALANLVTLPTEFDASRRGKKLLTEMHAVESAEAQRGVDKVLRAAANTYVAAFAISLVYFLRLFAYLMLASGHNRD